MPLVNALAKRPRLQSFLIFAAALFSRWSLSIAVRLRICFLGPAMTTNISCRPILWPLNYSLTRKFAFLDFVEVNYLLIGIHVLPWLIIWLLVRLALRTRSMSWLLNTRWASSSRRLTGSLKLKIIRPPRFIKQRLDIRIGFAEVGFEERLRIRTTLTQQACSLLDYLNVLQWWKVLRLLFLLGDSFASIHFIQY